MPAALANGLLRGSFQPSGLKPATTRPQAVSVRAAAGAHPARGVPRARPGPPGQRHPLVTGWTSIPESKLEGFFAYSGRTLAMQPMARTGLRHKKRRALADPDAAARKLVELANAFERVQDGRIYIELINAPFL